jgi:hypothetical protein
MGCQEEARERNDFIKKANTRARDYRQKNLKARLDQGDKALHPPLTIFFLPLHLTLKHSFIYTADSIFSVVGVSKKFLGFFPAPGGCATVLLIIVYIASLLL